MITISKERLQWLANISGRDDIDDIDGGEIRELALIALASLEAEPVAVNDDMASVAFRFSACLTNRGLRFDSSSPRRRITSSLASFNPVAG